MQLTIEKLVYGGDGLARLAQASTPETRDPPADAANDKGLRGKAVFVPFVLPGERVEARPVEEKRGFVRAALEKVLEASPQRVVPLCPYFQRCGGCHYQHINYDNQLAIKRQILAETLERTARIKWQSEIYVHASPPWGYRNRTRMKVATSPFALGYYRHNSHELLPVESCPISSPLINRAITVLWEIGRRGGFTDYSLFEIELFADHADARLLVELYVKESLPKLKWDSLVAELRERLPVDAVAAFLPKEPPSAHMKPRAMKLEHLFQPRPFIYAVTTEGREIAYQISPGSFFQTNRFVAATLVEIVCASATGKLAWDLYAGVGLFAAPLARTFDRVEAVESAPESFGDLEKNAPPNVHVCRMSTAAFLEQAARSPKGNRPDLVVVDPPRTGLGSNVTRKLTAIAPARLTYVSCDPATLARDLAVFLQSGYAMQQVHLVDLFPQTYHIESVVQLEKRLAGSSQR